MSGKGSSGQNVPPTPRPHSTPQSTPNVPESHSRRSPAERPKNSRPRRGESPGTSQRARPRDSPQAQSSGSWEGSSPASSGSPQAGSFRDPSGNSASTRLRETGRSTPGNSRQSTSSGSPDGSISSAGSSYQTSSSRSPMISSAKSSNKQGLSSRAVKQERSRSVDESSPALTRKQIYTKSAGDSNSASARSPGQFSQASSGETSLALKRTLLKSARESSYASSTSPSPVQSSRANPRAERASKGVDRHNSKSERNIHHGRRGLKQTQLKSAGEYSSARSTPRSPGESFHASSTERASKGEGIHKYKSGRRRQLKETDPKSVAESSSGRRTPRSPGQSSHANPRETAFALKRTQPKSAGESSARSTSRSPGQSSHASSEERPSEGEDIYNSKSGRRRQLKETHRKSAAEFSSNRSTPRTPSQSSHASPRETAFALKPTHPKSGGESSSAKITSRSPGQSSHASSKERASKGEDRHSSKSERRIKQLKLPHLKSAGGPSSARSTPRPPGQSSHASTGETALALKRTHPKSAGVSSSARSTPRPPGQSSHAQRRLRETALALKQTHPKSAGESSSARSTSRSPVQSSHENPRERASKGEDRHSSKSGRRIHHRRRRKDGNRNEHSSLETSGGSSPPSYRAGGPFPHSFDGSSSLGGRQQHHRQPQKHHQAGPSHLSGRTLGDRQPRLRLQTTGGGEALKHRSSSKHPRQRREHRANIKHDLESDTAQSTRKSPLPTESRVIDQDGRQPVPCEHGQTPPSPEMQFRVVDQDGRKPVPSDHGRTPPSPQQVRPRTGKASGRKHKYENFDQMIRVQRRQSLLSQKLHSGKAKIGFGIPISKRGKHDHNKSRKGRRDRIKERGPGSTTDANSSDSDVFARPIFNVLFEAEPSKSTAAFHRRASIIATLVRIRNWKDGSKIFRPSEFGALNKKVSNVSGDPFLDPSCSLFVNNELFESEAPDPMRKYGPVFVALQIPSSGVVLDPREALSEAGWVKSHPNDPIEKEGGIAQSIKNDDKLKRALHEASLPPVARRREGKELKDSTRNDFVQKRTDQESGAAMKPGPMQPDHIALSTLTGGNERSPPQPLESNEANQMVMVDLWSQGMEFDPATTWQQQAASVSSDGRPAPPPPPPSQETTQDNQVQTQDSQFQPRFSLGQQFGFQTDQQFGDGMSTEPSFGEQYAGSVQDPDFFPPQDPGFNGPQTPSSTMEYQTGILMGGTQALTFDTYARMNFSAQPTGMWPLSIWKRMKIDVLLMYSKASQHPCAPVSSWQDPLREPLLRTVPNKLRRKALAVFAHLMAYMGDVPTTQRSTWHMHQILSAGIRYRGLRDEVFCQIIKQTTANPSRLSNTKGWQAMAICCGIFLPSESFYPYLDTHLEQVAGGNMARQGTADQLGQHGQGMVNPLEAAAYSLERLRKVKRIGPRRLLPLRKEIEVVETMDTIPTEVALPDGSWQAFILRSIDTSEEVVDHLVNILGLPEARSYGLFQLEANGVEKLIASNSFILEVQSSCDTIASTPQNIQDIRFGAKTMEKLTRLLCGFKKEFEDNSLATVVLGSGGQQYSEGSLKMMLKRKLYLVDLEVLPEALKAVVLAFEYSQAVHDIVSSVHFVSEGDAMMLGALQLRADLGTSRVEPQVLEGIDGSKYGPPYCVQGNEGAWKDAIATTLASLPYSENASSWKQDYIDYVKSRCPLYEACMFFVKPLSNFDMPEEMYLAVSSTGITFVNANSKESFNFLEYAEIASWGYTPMVFSIIAGSMTISADTQFQTTQGLEISNTIQIYVDLLQGVQQRTAQVLAEDSAKFWDQSQQLAEGTFESVSFVANDGYQIEEMMRSQQLGPGELAQSLDQHLPLQTPHMWEQQPWSDSPLPPSFEGQQLSSAMSWKEQQAWPPPPPPPLEELAKRDHKHHMHQLPDEEEKKNGDRERKKHFMEQPKQTLQFEPATSFVLSKQGTQIGLQSPQSFSTISHSEEKADPQQMLLLQSHVKDES